MIRANPDSPSAAALLSPTIPSSAAAGVTVPVAPGRRTIWGLEPLQLHTRYWAAHGVQVVQQGEPSQIVKHAELYLLTDARSLVLFKLADVMEALNWIQPQVLFVRLQDTRERGYRERVCTDVGGRFARFTRLYDAADDLRLGRVVLTPDREIARLWQNAPDTFAAWRRLRRFIPRTDRLTLSVNGSVFDASSGQDVAGFLHDLLNDWKRPDVTVGRAKTAEARVWKDPTSQIDANAKFVGPVWVGAGRHIDGGSTVIGPAIVWDDPEARPALDPIKWLNIEPTEPDASQINAKDATPLDRAMKRLFDLCFATVALLLTLPLYPFIMLAIWLEDGRPFLFAHTRETLGGREFGCVKFRSMRKDAEKIKAELMKSNQADGPQFFMENDPRITRVGRVLRKYHLDELPQFFNVLRGDMSVVGPRPSPRKENQYCPPWREARLSVRPGISGLWQVCRTRRTGCDFQEWIKYDLEYVERRTFWLDLKIIFQTVWQIVHKAGR
jgi:lipopolysaccharide/colanic/teichoic acid biosynthesis glycosyltransferase